MEVARRLDQDGPMVRADHAAEAVGLPLEDVVRAARALKARGFVEALDLTAEDTVPWFVRLRGEGYVLSGLHPSGDDAVRDLVALLRQAADQVEDPEERSRLRALADGAIGIGRNTLGAVLTTWLTAQIPS